MVTSCFETPVEISSAEFEAYYLSKRFDISHYDYAGTGGGFHYLTLYSCGKNGSIVKLQGVFRVRDSARIAQIVKQPQQPIEAIARHR